MNVLLDSSEIKSAKRLFDELLHSVSIKSPEQPGSPEPVHRVEQEISTAPAALSKKTPNIEVNQADMPQGGGAFKGDRLEQTLFAMCQRGGFLGAVVADNSGLPLAAFNSPVSIEALAAFTTVLGGALEKSGQLLNELNADNISLDINYTDKVVLRKFTVSEDQYFLMIIAPKEVDERNELEASIARVTSILGPK